MRGAMISPGGKSILTMRSTSNDGEKSRIYPFLSEGAGVTLIRGDVHYVVTEFGIAYLHGKNIRERAMSLIAIAHPKFRPWLIEEAKRLGLIYKDQAFIPGKKGEYPEHLETYRTTNKGVKIFLRPVKIDDEPILFPEILARMGGRTVRALQLRDGSICRANTPEQRDLHNWAFGRLCRVMEDYCTSSPRIAEVVQAAEDSGFGGGSVRLAVRFYREARGLTPLQVIFDLHAQDAADPIPGLTWGTGVAELDSEIAELVEPWYATTGQDLGQDRPLMDRIFAAFATVLAKQWQRLDDHCQETGLGTVDLILQQRDARLGRKRRQPTFGGTTAESDDAI
jgi:hypothetical protein